MAKLDPKSMKAIANEAYAARFKRRDKKARRCDHHARIVAREQDWLLKHGIEWAGVPLALAPKGCS